MSRSNKTVENPADKFFEWDGKNGYVKYWDKQQEKEIEVDMPFHFLMLDTLTTIRGFHKKSDSGIYSNEVRSLNQILKVKTSQGHLVAEGIYDNIKDTIKASGGKFAKSVYIAYNEDGQMKIGNINFKGASLSPWIELEKEVGRRGLEEKAVVITGSTHEKSGDIEFEIPVMKIRDVKPEANQTAIHLDEQLQDYLEKKVDAVDIPESETTDVSHDEPINQDVPHPAERLHDDPVGASVDFSDDLEETIIEEDLPF